LTPNENGETPDTLSHLRVGAALFHKRPVIQNASSSASGESGSDSFFRHSLRKILVNIKRSVKHTENVDFFTSFFDQVRYAAMTV
jgi:hypothetical protein